MTEHKYAQVLRWIADGKYRNVQCKTGGMEKFAFIGNVLNGMGLTNLLIGELPEGYEFRLAPHTVKVGDVEIEAPIAEFSKDAWYFEPDGSAYQVSSFTSGWIHLAVESRMLFSSKEAAEAAHAAWVKLMRGDA